MPALKLLLRRTLALAAVNPPSVLSPPATAKRSLSPSGATTTVYCGVGGRRTLAIGKGGACSRIAVAHVMGPTASSKIKPSIYRKRVYMLSSSTSPPFPSSSAQERESGERESGESEGDKLDRVSSSSSSSASLLPDMGHGSHHKSNDGDWNPNGAVSPSDEDQKQPHSSKFLTLPTVLTLARVAAVPVFISTFYANSWWGAAATTSIFVAAAITDWLDGYLARKMCQGSAFGAFLDPVADKLMVAATLVLLCSRPPDNAMFGNIPWLLPVPAIAIIGREITMSAVREWAASQDAKLLQAVAVNNLGKWKTATQMTALTIILATRDSSIASQGALATSGVVLLYISAGLAVWSLVVYMKKIWKVLLR